MLKAIIIDDEIPNIVLLKRAIEKNGQLIIAGQFTSPKEALEAVNEIMPHIAFIDIEMPGMNGLELAERLQSIITDITVVFVTAYSQYAVDAFRVNALDYILKPLDSKEIDRVVSKIIERYSKDEMISFSKTISSNAKIICLGSFEVYGENGKVQLITAKIEELFAYLVMHPNKPADKWKLCDMLWPELPPKKAVTNLHTSIYRVKKTISNEKIPIQIKSNSYGYWVELEQTFFDYFVFLEYVTLFKENKKISNSDELLLLNAINLYNGEIFSDKDYIWIAEYKENTDRSYIYLLYLLSDFYKRNSQEEKEIYYLEKLLLIFPYEEEALIRLMNIYKKQNNKISLVKQYKRYEKYLNEEMDCNPSQKIEKIYKEIIKIL